MVKVSVLDYGMGNLFSVQRAIEHCGVQAELISKPDEISSADRLILPGVGAFADGMTELKTRGFVEPLREYSRSGKPFLGICLGMQMMLEGSEEFGDHEGLGVIPGKVRQISAVSTKGLPIKVPHIGWNALYPSQKSPTWSSTILEDIAEGAAMYFVHSFAAYPTNPEHILAEVNYGGHNVTAAVGNNTIFGCQFHPERSGEKGLRIVKSFLSL